MIFCIPLIKDLTGGDDVKETDCDKIVLIYCDCSNKILRVINMVKHHPSNENFPFNIVHHVNLNINGWKFVT